MKIKIIFSHGIWIFYTKDTFSLLQEALKDISKFDQKMKSTTADSLQTETR